MFWPSFLLVKNDFPVVVATGATIKTDGDYKIATFKGSGALTVNSLGASEDQSLALRKNYVGIGWTYDLERDAFINPKPVVPPEDEQYVYFDEFACLWIYNPPIPVE